LGLGQKKKERKGIGLYKGVSEWSTPLYQQAKVEIRFVEWRHLSPITYGKAERQSGDLNPEREKHRKSTWLDRREGEHSVFDQGIGIAGFVFFHSGEKIKMGRLTSQKRSSRYDAD